MVVTSKLEHKIICKTVKDLTLSQASPGFDVSAVQAF